MDNDQRDRRDPLEPPEPDESGEPPDQGSDDQLTADSGADAAEEPRVSAADIESWPSQDVADAPTPTEPPVADSGAVEAWPTEPPAAGSGSAETWPTEPPELGGEPILEPQASEPPAAEVEAYPAPAAWTEVPTSPSEPDAPEPVAATDEPAPEPVATTDEPAPESGEAPAGEPEIGAEQAAAVPGGATAESTLCPRCGTENQAGLSFCRSCGQRLVAAGVATTVDRPAAPEGTMACPRCGTHNRAGVAFCQNCGANLRGTSAGYVPPAVAGETGPAVAAAARGGAVLGPVVLFIGIVGLVTAYLLPFAYGAGSLFDRAFGAGGYGVSFWSGYPDGGLADQAYFGLAAASPILVAILAILAIAGFVRARPGPLQTAGLAVALLWSVGLIVLFVVVELGGNWGGDIVGLLRLLTPAGIIFMLTALIVLIGTLTRFGRS